MADGQIVEKPLTFVTMQQQVFLKGGPVNVGGEHPAEESWNIGSERTLISRTLTINIGSTVIQ